MGDISLSNQWTFLSQSKAITSVRVEDEHTAFVVVRRTRLAVWGNAEREVYQVAPVSPVGRGPCSPR